MALGSSPESLGRRVRMICAESVVKAQANKQTNFGGLLEPKGGSEPGTRSQFYSIGISSVLLAMSDWDEKPIRAL